MITFKKYLYFYLNNFSVFEFVFVKFKEFIFEYTTLVFSPPLPATRYILGGKGSCTEAPPEGPPGYWLVEQLPLHPKTAPSQWEKARTNGAPYQGAGQGFLGPMDQLYRPFDRLQLADQAMHSVDEDWRVLTVGLYNTSASILKKTLPSHFWMVDQGE